MQDFSQLSAAKQKLLQQHLRSKLAQQQSTRQQEIPHRRPQGPVALSFAQQRLWFLQQLDAKATSYNLPGAYQLTGPLYIAVLWHSIQEIVRRHETLRTQFVAHDGSPEQVILPERTLPLPLIDLSLLTGSQQQREVQRLSTQDAQRPFQLDKGPLFRIHLVRMQSDRHVLLFLFHHIIFDAWSIGLFIHELNVLYAAFMHQHSSPLTELPVSYSDYAVWQRQWFQGSVREQQTQYWLTQLQGMSPLNLPTDRPRPSMLSMKGAHYRARFPYSLLARLKALSQQEGVTLFMALVSTFQILAHRYTHQDDIVIGTSIANRLRPGTEHIIGFLVNTLLLRTDLSGNPSFQTVLKRVQRVIRDALTHQDMPFEELVAAIQTDRSWSTQPPLQVLFVFNNTPATQLQLGQTTAQPLMVESGSAKFDIMVEIQEVADGLDISFEYSTDLFEEDTIARLIAHWRNIIASATSQPAQRIGYLPFLNPEEEQRLLVGWNATTTDYPLATSFLHLFAAQVARTPDRVALVYGNQSLTYQEVDYQTTLLARRLLGAGVTTETLVALYLERSANLLITILAIWKCGGTYLPLDPAYPQERLLAIVGDAQPWLIITTVSLHATLTPAPSVKVYRLDDSPYDGVGDKERPCLPVIHPRQLAYIIYTSGSTGRPKGVMVTQQGMLNHLLAKVDDLQLSADDSVAQTASHCFDISVWQLLAALLTGGQTHIFSDDCSHDPEALHQQTQTSGITILEVVPSLLSVILQIETERHTAALSSLRWLVVTGEALPVSLCQHWFEQYSQLPLVNAYGPTECSDDVTHAFIYRGEESTSSLSMPIGRPIANTQIYILDEHLLPVPIGHSGQIYVGGVGVGRGYLHDVEKTARAFIPDPFTTTAGSCLYHTGDVGRYRADGSIEFLGRVDQQIKLRGYRIELGEIEALIAREDSVRECVVNLWEGTSGDQHLIAYVVPEDGEDFEVELVRQTLAQQLPAYMLPSAILPLPAFPLTPNGKIDRRSLPIPSFTSAQSTLPALPPSPTEELLASIFAEVLQLPHVSVTDQFFALGGHSLLATQVIARVRQRFHLDLPVRALFEAPGVRALARLIEQQRSSSSTSALSRPPLLPVDRNRPLPLSFAQQRLWFLHQFDPTTLAYHLPVALQLQGTLQLAALTQSFQQLLDRHEILRTTLHSQDGETFQQIEPSSTFLLPLVDLTGLPLAEQSSAPLLQQLLRIPFDLRHGPLLRGLLLRLASQEHVLLLSMDHSISDGWSMGILLREIRALYQAACDGQTPALPPLPVQYADFALWQRQLLSADYLAPHLHYWQQQLGQLPTLQLPTDFPRPALQTFTGARQRVRLSGAQRAQLVALSQRSGSTLFMTLLSLFGLLLARYSGQQDLPIGTPIANRTQPELEGLIGFFVNTLVLRLSLVGDPSFEQLVARVRELTLDAYAHQEVPFEQVVESLQLPRDPARSPLFQVMFVLQNATPLTQVSESFAGLQPTLLDVQPVGAKFDLTLTVDEETEGLSCTFEYNRDLFAAATIQRLARHWLLLVDAALAHPEQPVGTLPLLTPEDRHLLLEVVNATETPYAFERSIQQRLAEQFASRPDQIAVTFEQQQLSYGELERRSNQLAHFLHAQGIGPDRLVGLCLQRSLELVIAILAVLKAGGAYVPLDPDYPTERLRFLIEDTHLSLVLTQYPLLPLLPSSDCRRLCLDRDWILIAGESDAPLPTLVHPEQLAYMIYTSGSTGLPKGAMNTQQALLNRLLWMQQRYQLDATDCVLQKTPFSFDVSVWEFFWPLLAGARLLLAAPEGQRDSAYLVALIRQQAVSLCHFVPSMLSVFLQEPEVSHCQSLRDVICSGEALSFELQQRFFARLGAGLHNLYGPTEAAIDVTAWTCQPESLRREVPIGRPIANLRVYVLDERLRPLPIGVPGELYLGGIGLARGYAERPALTAERFVPDPLSQQPGARLYRTGDRVRWLEDGTLSYLGRLDFQVKIRGQRIELGEIEQQLERHPAVREAVVLAREEQPGHPYLAAYLVIQQDNAPTQEELLKYLQGKLPHYMLPAHFLLLDELPLTTNGKVDRKALPAPQRSLRQRQTDFVAPRTPEEELLAGIWSTVLDLPRVSIYDNFFSLGGDSILSLQAVSKARKAGLQLQVKDFFQYQTIAELSPLLHIQEVIVDAPSGPHTGPVPLTPVQHWFFSQQLPAPDYWNQAILLKLSPTISLTLLEQALCAVLQQHEILHTRFHYEQETWQATIPAQFGTPDITRIDLSHIPASEQEAMIVQLTNHYHASLKLTTGLLSRIVLFETDPGKDRQLLIVIHHLVIDGVSWRILLEDVHNALQGQDSKRAGTQNTYQQWAEKLRVYAQSERLLAEVAYWQAALDHPVRPLHRDFPDGENLEASARTISFTLSHAATTALLQQVPAAYNMRINDTLLAALALAFDDWQHLPLFVDVEGHGREELFADFDPSQAIGWFTSIFPLYISISHAWDLDRSLVDIKEQIRAIPDHGIGYGLLRYLCQQSGVRDTLARYPQAEVSFNYLGQFDQIMHTTGFSLAQSTIGLTHQPAGPRPYLIEIVGSINEQQLTLGFTYSAHIHRADTIQRLVDTFYKRLTNLIAYCQQPGVGRYTPSDFPLITLTQEQLDTLVQSAAKNHIQQGQSARECIQDIYPLTPTQHGLLFHSLYALHEGVYVQQTTFTIDGALDIEHLLAAWQEVTQRHTVLRTALRIEPPVQIVYRAAQVPLRTFDWQDLAAAEQDAQLQAYLKQDREQGFLLDQPPLQRLAIFHLGQDSTMVCWSYHHAILDGWSIPLVFNDILVSYQARVRNQPCQWQSVRAYRDYVAWLQQQSSEASEHFWRSSLQGIQYPTPLPDKQTDQKRPAAVTYLERTALLTADDTQKLQAFTRHYHITIHSLLQGIWALLLSRYSGESTVLFGTTVAGRPAELIGVEMMVGLFINTLPLAIRIPAHENVVAWLQQLQLHNAELQQYEYSSLVQIQAWNEVAQGRPLFESILVVENYPLDSIIEDTRNVLDIHSIQTDEQTNYPLVLMVVPGEQLHIKFVYDSTFFTQMTIERLLETIHTLIKRIMNKPEQEVDTLLQITQNEQQQLRAWNATETPYALECSIQQRLAEQFASRPDQIAVIFEQQQLSYGELERRSNQLAHFLHAQGIGPDRLVGLCLQRSLELVIAILAILKAGGAYVPLDPDYPTERLRFLIEDTHLSLVLTQYPLLPMLPSSDCRRLCLDRDWILIAGESDAPLPTLVHPEQLAYMIYTSGSTGLPKGAMNTQRALLNRLLWMQQRYQLDATDCVLQKTPFSFDVSVWEFFWPLLAGARLLLAAPEGQRDSAYLVALIRQQAVSLCHFVPSMLSVFLQEPEVSHCQSLRDVICSGEALSFELQQRFFARLGAGLHNLYGPTEAAIDVTAWTCQPESLRREVPIGRPIANLRVYVLDERLRPLPVGVPGELYLGGIGLARGYAERPALTAERFVPDPLSQQPGARLYRTGDRVRWLEDGTLSYLGRLDFQVKIRGQRIELGEIEQQLERHPAVREAVVLAREEQPGHAYLAAYVVPEDGEDFEVELVRQTLAQQLPAYMLPSAILPLPAFPLTPNGKIDRRSLPIPSFTSAQSTLPALPPSPTEELLASIFAEVLQLPRVSVTDQFFALGGHSLLATQVVARVRQRFHLDLPVRALFEAPGVRALARLIEQQHSSSSTSALSRPPLLPVDRNRPLPLSFAQQRLWFLHQFDPTTLAYHLPVALQLQGTLQLAALTQSFQQLLDRHEILRTTLHSQDGETFQQIEPSSTFLLPLVDLTGLPPAEQSSAPLLQQLLRIPFDLRHGPLLRGLLLRLASQEHVLLLSMDHSISDGWSMGILLREIRALYQAACDGQTPALPPLPVQYADFALWQRQLLSADYLAPHLHYWQQQLGQLPTLQLPTDFPRPALQTFTGARQRVRLSSAQRAQLVALSQRSGSTLFMTLLSLFGLLLARYSGQQDLPIGTPIANRTQPELEGLIGFFVNTLVLRLSLVGDPSFEQLVARVRELTLDAYAHQEVPFEQVVESLQLPRDPARSPLFQVMFVLQNATPLTQVSESFAGLQPTLLDVQPVGAKFDLTLTVDEETEGLSCTFEYNRDLFAAATIQRLARHWLLLVDAALAHPEQPVGTLPLLTPEERQQILGAQTAHQIKTNADRHALPYYIEQQVLLQPDAIGLVFQDEQITYTELNQRANQLAHFLHSQGARIGMPIGVYLERSLALPLAILAILKAGGTYVPLDPSLPPERLAFMLADTAMPLLLTQQAWRERIPSELTHVLVIDAYQEQLTALPEHNLPTISSEVPAYIIYTSGSTGTPKGVVVQHKQAARLFQTTEQQFHFQASDTWTLFHSYAFDFSVWEIWGPLLYGGKLVVVPYLVTRDPDMFHHLLEEQAVTILNQTPSAFQQLVQSNQRLGSPRQLALRFIIFGGEALDPQRLQPWIDVYGLENPQLINMYGITETTVHVTYHQITARDVAGEAGSTIGSALVDLQLYVLDRYLQCVPFGVAGELYVGGEGVSAGYLQRPALTAERFIPHPYSQIGGARLYRTGDLACLHIDGTFQYLGRIDEQVKIRGFRIELGEIEAQLVRHPHIQDAIVLARGEMGEERNLIAYIVPQQQASLSIQVLRAFLQTALPDYMLPSAFVQVESFPLTRNGKVDRQALFLIEDQSHVGEREVEGEQLHNPLEALVADTWREILGVPVSSARDNFFAIGGQSLLATRVIAQLRKVVQSDLPLHLIFEYPTVEGLAQQIEQRIAGAPIAQTPPLVPLAQGQTAPLSFAQQRLWFLDQLESGSSAYTIPIAVELQGRLHLRALEQSIATIIERHESLRTHIVVENDQPIQVIQQPGTFQLPIIDLSTLDREAQTRITRTLLRQNADRSFNLTTGPLFATTLIRLEPTRYLFLWSMHHIIADGWSLDVLVRELSALYNHVATQVPFSLASLPIQYRDYAIWQRQWLRGTLLAQHLDYWREQLKGVRPLEITTDYPRPPRPTQHGAHYIFTLPAQLKDAIHRAGQQEGTTLFMTLLAAFQIFLYRYTGQADVVVGTDIANRTHVETEGLIGFFVNLLPLRTNLSGNPSFQHVLQRVRDVVLGAYKHYDTPFEMLVEHLRPEHEPNRLPIVQILLVLQNQPQSEPQMVDLTLQVLQHEITSAKFEIALFLQEGKDGLEGIVVYNTDLFKEETIATMMQQFVTLLDSATQHSDTPINLLTRHNQLELSREAQQRKERLSTGLRKLKRGKATT
ncbi:hypothetical protein KDA_39990 [Dictyobacter alpinus]|uniref:Carrier domain-containing protein n=1 Tax=Dictyobacter alpinus TaxID=2014873 RepID=A0A402BAY8_9CHLR|nr:non-ribosomal peptide synthetase [Dictyobacter alpinus]GCE28515.1 hypothetical protein KDA_39990 [Dictyobacter alpinus]